MRILNKGGERVIRKNIVVGVLLAAAVSVLAAPGDTIDEFYPDGGPDYGAWGFARDPADGNIWAAGPDTYEFCKLGKFENNPSHNMIIPFEYIWGPVWIIDIAYPYECNGVDCIAITDGEISEIGLYNPYSHNHEGDIPVNPFTGGCNSGIAANPDNNHLFAANRDYKEILEWDGTSWNIFTTFYEETMYTWGVAYGWNHLFVAFGMGNCTPKIVVFDENGEYVEEYELTGWHPSGQIAGMGCARENAVGDNESVYVCSIAEYGLVKEVEVGNFGTLQLDETTFGGIKAMFR